MARPEVAVMQGTLDLIILRALSVAPMHGWGISARIDELSGGFFQVGQGSLYPALQRFEAREWVTSLWKQTDNHRIARYYELTTLGRRALAEEAARWSDYAAAMGRLIGAP
jgi:transcriptional regulator